MEAEHTPSQTCTQQMCVIRTHLQCTLIGFYPDTHKPTRTSTLTCMHSHKHTYMHTLAHKHTCAHLQYTLIGFYPDTHKPTRTSTLTCMRSHTNTLTGTCMHSGTQLHYTDMNILSLTLQTTCQGQGHTPNKLTGLK
jgi:hypothetical protein